MREIWFEWWDTDPVDLADAVDRWNLSGPEVRITLMAARQHNPRCVIIRFWPDEPASRRVELGSPAVLPHDWSVNFSDGVRVVIFPDGSQQVYAGPKFIPSSRITPPSAVTSTTSESETPTFAPVATDDDPLPAIMDLGPLNSRGRVVFYEGGIEIHVSHKEIELASGSAQAAAEKKWKDRKETD